MYKTIVIWALAIVVTACKTEKKEPTTKSDKNLTDSSVSLTINGYIPDYKKDSITIHYFDYTETLEMDLKVNKLPVKAGKFAYSTKLPFPTRARLLDTKTNNWLVDFYAENGTVTISGKIGELKVSGGKLNKAFAAFQKISDENSSNFLEEYRENVKPDGTYDKEKGDQTRELFEKRYKQRKFNFIAENPDSHLALNKLLYESLLHGYNDIYPAYEKLNENLKKSYIGKFLEKRLELLNKSAVGKQSIDFIQKDINDNLVDTKKFRGNYLYLDFWASWCGPCRAENPNVVKAYNAYKHKGFNVLAVSVDDKMDRWKKAIEEDGLPWTQVSDLNGMNNEAAKLYGIKSVPTTLLINPEGIIIAKNLKGTELQKKLKEIYSK